MAKMYTRSLRELARKKKTPPQRRIAVSEHALDRYRERVRRGATDADVIRAYERAVPVDPVSKEKQWWVDLVDPNQLANPNTIFSFNHAKKTLFVSTVGHEDSRFIITCWTLGKDTQPKTLARHLQQTEESQAPVAAETEPAVESSEPQGPDPLPWPFDVPEDRASLVKLATQLDEALRNIPKESPRRRVYVDRKSRVVEKLVELKERRIAERDDQDGGLRGLLVLILQELREIKERLPPVAPGEKDS